MNEQGAVLFFNEEERVWELVTMDVDTPQGVGCGSGRAQGSGGRRLGDRRAVQDVPEGGGITEGLVHGLWAKEERSVDSAFAPCWSQGNDPRPTLTRPASGEVRAMQDGLEGVPGTSEVCRPGLPGHGTNSHLGKARFLGHQFPASADVPRHQKHEATPVAILPGAAADQFAGPADVLGQLGITVVLHVPGTADMHCEGVGYPKFRVT